MIPVDSVNSSNYQVPVEFVASFIGEKYIQEVLDSRNAIIYKKYPPCEQMPRRAQPGLLRLSAAGG